MREATSHHHVLEIALPMLLIIVHENIRHTAVKGSAPKMGDAVDINILCRLFQHRCRRRAAFAGLNRNRGGRKRCFLLFSGSAAPADRDIDC